MGFAGIDLGNSRVKVAIPDAQGNPVMLSNDVGELYTPSVVFFEKDDNIIIGSEAQNAGLLEPHQCVAMWKRHMGSSTVLHTCQNGQEYKAKDIACLLLKHVARIYEQRTGELLGEAAISVPANYTDRQKAETLEAATAAGMKVVVTPHEPTSAAIGNYAHKRGDGLIMVFDLGGGTFDVTIIRLSGNNAEVLATNGEPDLGGQDFTEHIGSMVLEGYEGEHGIRPNRKDHPLACQELATRAEQAKITLSSREQTQVVLACHGHVHAARITRDEFQSRTAELINKAMMCAEETCTDAGIKLQDISEIIPAGGAAQMPCFLEAIEERFGKKPSFHADPYYAVALGTMTIGRLTKEREGEPLTVKGRKLPPLEYRLQEVTSHPIGVSALNENNELVNTVILAKGKPIPADYSRPFELAEKGQKGARIRVLQGPDGAGEERCQLLGELRLEDLKAVTDRVHRIDVRLRFDTNGMLELHAVDALSGRQEEMIIDYNDC